MEKASRKVFLRDAFFVAIFFSVYILLRQWEVSNEQIRYKKGSGVATVEEHRPCSGRLVMRAEGPLWKPQL